MKLKPSYTSLITYIHVTLLLYADAIHSGLLHVSLSQITSSSGEKIGKVAKQWSGWGMELFTDADTFSVTCE